MDLDLSQKLAGHNIKFSGQVESTFIKTLLSWFVPILLFVGVWYLMSEKELLAKIDVLLGGRVAEEIQFNSVTTGDGNDLMRATDITRAMVVEYGMGKTLGLSTYPRQRGPAFLASDGGYGGRQDYSDSTAADIDTEVKAILEQRYQHVLSMLKECRDKLEAIAEQLLAKEVLMEAEFNQLVNSR